MRSFFSAPRSFVIIAGLFFCLLGFSEAQAAGAHLLLTPTGESTFKVTAMFSSGEAQVNAIEGVVSYPSALITLRGVSDGDSIISLWIVRPQVPTSSGALAHVHFSGIIPGGYGGPSGPLFSLSFESHTSSAIPIRLDPITVLKADGFGSIDPTATSGLVVLVPPSDGNSVGTTQEMRDTLPPEPFTPTLVKDDNLAPGKYFLVFATTDKQSGIDHYEIIEAGAGYASTPQGAWERARSPYLLKDQSLGSTVYVRAVDRAGNFIVVTVFDHGRGVAVELPRRSFPWTWLLLFLVCVTILVVFRRQRRSSRN